MGLFVFMVVIQRALIYSRIMAFHMDVDATWSLSCMWLFYLHDSFGCSLWHSFCTWRIWLCFPIFHIWLLILNPYSFWLVGRNICIHGLYAAAWHSIRLNNNMISPWVNFRRQLYVITLPGLVTVFDRARLTKDIYLVACTPFQTVIKIVLILLLSQHLLVWFTTASLWTKEIGYNWIVERLSFCCHLFIKEFLILALYHLMEVDGWYRFIIHFHIDSCFKLHLFIFNLHIILSSFQIHHV